MPSTTAPATWFITGASRGIGLELVRQLLAQGDNVAATTRSTERLTAALGGTADTSRLLALTVDLTDEAEVGSAVDQAAERFGRLDVVVNNAGYGFLAAVEETSTKDVRDMLDVQVVGVWNVLRAALPVLREQRAGRVINISSILGLTTMPGWALYCAGKFALEGLSEALAAEVADLGIKVTVVEPGYFRTSFLTTDSLALPAETSKHYPAVRTMVEDHLELQGRQLGDPVKGAAAIIERAGHDDGPLRQLLGSDAHAYATAKVDALRADLDATAASAATTDFPGV
ncbi:MULTISPECIES: SDR family oxidoreductase [unclassified Streptomyces]|uniref:SDR family oxidoreductase n=1 Tax=unclassified Streptomyces TaxID=2593676 RepID=UPI0001C1ABBA|nr:MULTISPECIES: SDR family oxidoreductase [unclassified Streptomyces]AEN08439.1 short-chain dehydrogenase/reductase SDR [Streptomyces sp. SirexAA-E]MYR69372.1 SDR family NAD(P)-dependent oxidoreductase [Streptomyces sp. SID4939]MYS02168.1 SDR family NAD(P)-dependent oxidoreductase [Streptomyces sp. SID4940]MYT66415.1 SDR family NAD(P)-dependent oxidoreductase [Streptomyces sp. SID8357]MYT83336.1 SDR family NAD(P)-dependent oxidoreductase [Streptomyces sp. SID8360]